MSTPTATASRAAPEAHRPGGLLAPSGPPRRAGPLAASATFMSLGLAVLLPPTFASNIFVQPRTMPGWLQAFVKVNPISHLADAARDLMNNTGGAGGPVAWSLIVIAAITLVFAPITLHLYNKQA